MKIAKIAIIVASGQGIRMGGAVAKQYLKLDNETILYHSIKKFTDHKLIDGVIVVINENHQDIFKKIAKKFDLLKYVIGGKERQDSVRLGLEAIREFNPDKVLIHDAVRPFVDKQTIDKVIKGLGKYNAVVPVCPISDTVKEVSHGGITKTLNRGKLRLAQTPQGYNFTKLVEIINKAPNYYTDEAALFESQGLEVRTTLGKKSNFKITYEEDLYMARLAQGNMRVTKVGHGIDVHKFGDIKVGGRLIMGGVLVDYNREIIAHSDGDIVVHAIVDAILGAIGEGDIGKHFPSSESKWKNVNSFLFLEKSMALLEEADAEIVNIDITIICQKPNLSKYKNEMEEKLADFIQIDKKVINVKATTTDNLGFIGKEEGIAVMATAAVSMLIHDM